MRQVIAAAFVLALSATPSIAASGHWYCTADGIKSWTTDPSTFDAAGWTYGGNRSSYKDGGHCEKKM